MTKAASDARYALRALRRAPIFSTTVILTLALGIGVNAALFSALEALLLRPLPFPESERLVALFEAHPQRGRSQVSLAVLGHWREQTASFEALAGFRFRTFALGVESLGVESLGVESLGVESSVGENEGGGDDRVIQTAMATSELFQVLGRPLLAGRFWTVEEELGSASVVVLSEDLWRSRFAGSPEVVGQRVRLNEVPFTVLGIAPGVVFPSRRGAPEAYIPIDHAAYGGRRSVRSLEAIGRLRHNVAHRTAAGELRMVAARVEQSHPEGQADWLPGLEDLHESLHGGNRRPLFLLLVAGGLLLLIAYTNVAHLLVARFLDRRRKIAIRIALGARLGPLVRLFFVEMALLSGFGGLLGLLVARASLASLPPVIALLGGSSQVAGVGLDLRLEVLLFVAALCLLAIVGASFLGVAMLRRTDIQQVLKEGGSSPQGRGGFRGVLVIGQIALSVVLLLSAGLLLRSFLIVLNADRGFDSQGVQRFGLGLPEARYDERQIVEFHRRLLRGLAAIDGVEAAGVGVRVPAGPRLFMSRFAVEGQAPAEEPPRAALNVVSEGFFAALRISRVLGRGFESSERPDSPRVVVVNQAFWKTHLESSPQVLGTRLRLSWSSALHPRNSLWKIVGVVGDTRLRGLEQAAEPAVYLPVTQFPVEGATYLIRTDRADADLHAAVRGAVALIDPSLVPPVVSPLEQLVRRGLSDRRLGLTLVGVFASLGLSLTMIGVYGLMAFHAARRQREMAIRLALGARREQISELLVGHGMRLAGSGIALGVAAFVLVARWIESQLFGVGLMDPATLVGVGILVCAVALAASLPPSWRAAKVSPSSLLRAE